MESPVLRRGPKSFPLEESKKELLYGILTREHISIKTLARRIRISEHQLRHPLRTETGECSLDSYRKITRFCDKVNGEVRG